MMLKRLIDLIVKGCMSEMYIEEMLLWENDARLKWWQFIDTKGSKGK